MFQKNSITKPQEIRHSQDHLHIFFGHEMVKAEK